MNTSRPLIDDYDIATVEHVTKHFRLPRTRWGARPEVHSVDDVSLHVRAGEVLGLVGESGSGKSTLARLLLGLVPADSGRIEVDQQRVGRLRGVHLRRLRRSAQLVFQDPHAALDPRMTIEDSMLAPLQQHGIGTPGERRDAVRDALREVGLEPEFLARRPRDCSGGQLQRVVIARALLLKPRLLVCDEPTSALDASVQATILNLLMDMRRARRLGILFISHDLRVVHFIADRVAVMYLGQIVEVGDHDEIFERPRHPYTIALLRSGHGPDLGGEPPLALQGEVPSPVSPPPGCRFASRCPLAIDRCRSEAPPRAEAGPGHEVSCHRQAESRTLMGAEEVVAG